MSETIRGLSITQAAEVAQEYADYVRRQETLSQAVATLGGPVIGGIGIWTTGKGTEPHKETILTFDEGEARALAAGFLAVIRAQLKEAAK